MSDMLSDDLPTLLFLGEGEPLRPALEEALRRHATFAENADEGSAVAAVQAAAPDVVVLVGDAAERAEDVLSALAAHSMTRSVPVIVLLEAGNLTARLRAARSGVAVVERSASADAMARDIARFARELPEQGTSVVGEFGEATVGDVLDIVRRELESGILSVHQEDGDGARFVLRQGRHVDQAIRDFVARIRPLVEAAQPLSFDYDGAGAGLLDDATEEGNRDIFAGRRVALVEDDAAVADALAQELRAHKAEVVVLSSGAGVGVARAHHLDPEVVLVEERGLDGPAYQVLREIRSDPRLRWASLLVIRGDELMPEGRAPRMDRLAGAFAPLLAPDEEVTRRAKEEDSFDMRLEALGPSRLLRAVIRAGGTFLVRVRHPRVNVDVSISQGLVAGADAMRFDGSSSKAGGPVALAALLAISGGRVTIERRDAPASANVFMPLAAALEAAAQESPPIRPSVLPSDFKKRVSEPPEKLMAELESVLGKLRASGMVTPESRVSHPPTQAAKAATAAVPLPPPPIKPRAIFRAPSSAPSAPSALSPSSAPGADDTPTTDHTASTDKVHSKAKAPPPPPPPLVRKPKPRKSAAPPVRAQRPRRKARHKTLVGTGAVLASALNNEEVDPEQHERPTSPPPSMASMEELARAEDAAAEQADEALTAAKAAAAKAAAAEAVARLPDSEPPQASSPERNTPALPFAAPLPEPHSDSATSLTPSAVPAVGVAVEEARPPLPGEATMPMASLPPLISEPTLPMGRPQGPPLRQRALPIAIVLGLLLIAGVAFWVMSEGDEEVVVEAPTPDTTPHSTDTPSATPVAVAPAGTPTTSDTPPTNVPNETVEDETVEDDVEDDVEDETVEDATVEDEDESGEGPGANASRSERISWNLQSGNFHRNRGHAAMAARRYQTVLRMMPRNGRALAGLARVAIMQNDSAGAVRYARRLVRVNANNAGNRVLLGDALQADGKRAEARAEWERALTINRRHRGARRRLGQ
ncbi:MAG: hypothetical protein AB8H86_31825 [Polyangiales bacterium]